MPYAEGRDEIKLINIWRVGLSDRTIESSRDNGFVPASGGHQIPVKFEALGL